jgi:hypothetical protein
MLTFTHTQATVLALGADSERVRDGAAESLGDMLEGGVGSTAERQSALDALGRALETETSQLVIESILNAMSNAKHSDGLHLPRDVVGRRRALFAGSAIELAKYILDEG